MEVLRGRKKYSSVLAMRVVRIGVVFGNSLVESVNSFKIVLTPHVRCGRCMSCPGIRVGMSLLVSITHRGAADGRHLHGIV